MNGHIIPGTCIAVDFWKTRGVQEKLIHFLTHLHGDHIVGLTSSWARPIYCSEFTAQILQAHHGISKSLMNVLYVNHCTLIKIPNSSDSFCVTAYDANHCPGAIMLYFEGTFGNIFYTGDFRYSSDMDDSLHHMAGKVDKLYLDNTFCSPKCDFPSREECQERIAEIAKDHPDSDIIIGIRKLGKELMLGMLALELNETIFVSHARYQISRCIFDSNVFAVPIKDQKTRIRTLPIHTITREFVYKKNQISPTIAILPTAIFTGLGCKPFSRDPDIFLVPYSDHSSFPEIVEFVRRLQPRHIFPIVTRNRGPFGKDISDRSDMSLLESYVTANEISCSSLHSYSAVSKNSQKDQSHEKPSHNDNVNTSFTVHTAAKDKKFLHFKSTCEGILVPIHSLKRKASFPDNRKKKIAKGVVFMKDLEESQSVGNNQETASESMDEKNTFNSQFSSQMNVEETLSCGTNKLDCQNMHKHCSNEEEYVMDSVIVNTPSQDGKVLGSSANIANVNDIDHIIIDNRMALNAEEGVSTNEKVKDDENLCSVVDNLGHSEEKESHCVSKMTSINTDSPQSSKHNIETEKRIPELRDNVSNVESASKLMSVTIDDIESVPDGMLITSKDKELVPDNMPATSNHTESVSENMPITIDDAELVPDNVPITSSNTKSVPENMPITIDDAESVPNTDNLSLTSTSNDTDSMPGNVPITISEKESVPDVPITISDTDSVPDNLPITISDTETVPDDMPITFNEKESVPDNVPMDDDIVIENLVALDRDFDIKNQGHILDAGISQNHEVSKCKGRTHFSSNSCELGESVLSSSVVQELNFKELLSYSNVNKSSETSIFCCNKDMKNECGKINSRKHNDKIVVRTPNFSTQLRSKRNKQQLNVRQLLHTVNKRTKVNNDQDFHNALTDLM